MTPQGKKALIIVSSLLLIGGTVGYILWDRNKKKKDELAKLEAEEKAKAEELAKKGTPSTPGDVKKPSDNERYLSAVADARRLRTPTFVFDGKTYDTATGKVYVAKIEGDTAIGKTAYPSLDIVKVRSAPRVEDGMIHNTLLGTINKPNAIGTVINTTWGADKFRWYEVTILTPLRSPVPSNVNAKTGWVRADVIKFTA